MIRKNKILHVITSLDRGGAEKVLYQLVTSDEENLHEVICLGKEGFFTKKLRNKGILVHSLNLKKYGFNFIGLFKMYKIITNNSALIVQTWMYHADLIGGLLCWFASKENVIWGIRNSNLDKKNSKFTTKIVVFLLSKFSKYIPKRIISCSEEAAKIHINLGYDKNKFIIIHNGFKTNEIKPNSKKIFRIKKLLKISEKEMVFGSIGRWDSQKDYENLFSALSMVKNKINPWKLILAGNELNNTNNNLIKLIKNFNLEKNIILVGFRKKITTIINCFDLHILSSGYGEAFPNVLAEAMSCEIPCISTTVGESPNIIGETGWSVPPKDSLKLSRAIMDAMQEFKRIDNWKKRKINARKRIVDNFSFEKMLNNYNSIWRSFK